MRKLRRRRKISGRSIRSGEASSIKSLIKQSEQSRHSGTIWLILRNRPSTSRRYLAQPSLPSTSTTNPSKSIPTGPRAQSGLAVSVSRPGPSTRPSAPSSPSLPTGPRALTGRPVPTGPRVLTASYSTQAQLAESPPEDSLPAFGSNKTRASRSSSRTTSESKTRSVSPGSGISKSDEDMPSTARSPRTNSRTARRKPAYKASNKQLEGPLRDQKQIMEEFGKGAKVDPKWADNPKSRLIVYWGSEAGGDFTCEEGVVDGKQIYR